MSAEVLIASHLRIAREEPRGRPPARQHGQSQRDVSMLSSGGEDHPRRPDSEGKNAGIKHQLDELVDMIPDENPLKPGLRAIQDLTDYATSYRYPSPKGRIKMPPSKLEFERDANAVEAALESAAQRFGVDLDKPEGPARTPGPVR